MSTASPKPQPTLTEWGDVLIDFGLPALVFGITGVLIFCGKDSEIKTVFAASAGWLFNSGIRRRRKS